MKSIQWLERGSVQTRVRRAALGSEFCQDYILQAGAPVLKIATTVDWQESGSESAFPLNLADYATYEILAVLLNNNPAQKPQLSRQSGKFLPYAGQT